MLTFRTAKRRDIQERATGQEMATAEDIPLEEEDTQFLDLIGDYYAECHVFLAEGEGALIVEQFFKENSMLREKSMLIYADTGEVAHCHAARMRQIGIPQCRVFDSTLDVIVHSRYVLSNLSGSARIYCAGSRSFLQLIQQLASDTADPPRAVMLQRREIYWRRVMCGECGAFMEYALSRDVTCAECAAELVVTDFYSIGPSVSLGVKRSTFDMWSASRD